jgi:hypothetical protein
MEAKPSIQMEQAAYLYGSEYQHVLVKLGWRQMWSPPYVKPRELLLKRMLLEMVRPMIVLRRACLPTSCSTGSHQTWRPRTSFGAIRDDRPANKLAPRSRQGLYMGMPTDTSFDGASLRSKWAGPSRRVVALSVTPGSEL